MQRFRWRLESVYLQWMAKIQPRELFNGNSFHKYSNILPRQLPSSLTSAVLSFQSSSLFFLLVKSSVSSTTTRIVRSVKWPYKNKIRVGKRNFLRQFDVHRWLRDTSTRESEPNSRMSLLRRQVLRQVSIQSNSHNGTDNFVSRRVE